MTYYFGWKVALIVSEEQIFIPDEKNGKFFRMAICYDMTY